MERKSKVRITPVLLSILMMLSLILSMTPMQAFAAYPSTITYGYERWKQNDSKWGKILLHDSNSEATLGGYGCAATSVIKLLAHSGICSDDESVFNPATCLPVLKKANVFSVEGVIRWGNVTNAYPDFKYYKGYTMSGTQAEMLKEVQKNHKAGYYQIVKVKCGIQHWVSVHSISDSEVYIMDSGGYGYTKLSDYEISGPIRLYKAPNPATWREKPLPEYDYTNVPAGTYYFKNKSTGTYLSVDSATAANGQNISVAAKKETAAFQFKTTGGTDQYFYSMINTAYVVNPDSNSPSSGTNVTLFKKDNSGTQIWKFEKVSGGYVIHLKCNPICILTVKGSNVQLASRTGADAQIWTLEDATKAPATLSSIAINADSVGTIYENGSQMDTSGLTLTATYSDKTKKTISSGYSLTRPSLTAAGTKTLTVTYEGKTATLDITVQDLFKGNGTASEPYLITTDEDLKNLANMVNNTSANPCYGTAHYKQTADIDLSLYDWTPIGTFYASANDDTTTSRAVFNGTYNGNFHKITGLHVNYKRMYTGLFGRTNANAVIENLSVTGSVISTGSACIGGIVGEAGYGSTIRNCDFSGSVTGTNLVGAIAGKLHAGGTISNCYANADVAATNGHAGGIAGNITVGNKTNSVDGLVENSYFAGTAAGTANGGICGSVSIQTVNESTLTFKNCYYLNSAANGAVNGTAQSGCMGLISSQLKTIAPDLGTPFVNNPNAAINDGYPVFEWQLDNEGDVNADGQFTVLDLVMLQKWLLCAPDASLADWQAGDLCADETIDAFDLAIMKRKLLSKS